MKTITGSNAQDMKAQNRGLVLRLVSTSGPLSRSEISQRTGLTKMTATNIINELLNLDVVREYKPEASNSSAGRNPGMLDISENSPVILGISVGRSHCKAILTNYKAQMIAEAAEEYPPHPTEALLLELIVKLFYDLKNSTSRTLAGIGISAPGPLNTANGTILNPPNFHGIRDFPIVSQLEAVTGLPCYLMNDSSAGALAEKLYGCGKELSGFVYLHFYKGIGAGLVADNHLFDGSTGLVGEIGHMSINFAGPRCGCGNTGCLELYANEEQAEERARSLLALSPNSSLTKDGCSWLSIVNAANHGDPLACSALEPLCGYLSQALVNYLNLMDCCTVLLGYEGENRDGMIEQAVERGIRHSLMTNAYRNVTVRHSFFGSTAPIVGSAAVVANEIFLGRLPFAPKV